MDTNFLTPELQIIFNSAVRRLQSWRPPPNWSAADWSAECRQIGQIAAYRLAGSVDASAEAGRDRSIYNRLIASVRTCYRREWAYSLHFETRPTNVRPDKEELRSANDDHGNESADYAALYDAIEELTPDQRQLIEQLFFLGRTEAEAGRILGLSQRVVSNRKQHALKDLCASLRRVLAA